MNGQFEYAADRHLHRHGHGRPGRARGALDPYRKRFRRPVRQPVGHGVRSAWPPALVMYEWALSGMGKLGWLAAFLYAAAPLAPGALQHPDRRRQPLFTRACPARRPPAWSPGLMWVLHAPMACPARRSASSRSVFTVFAALSMVSNIRYHSFKHFNLQGRVSVRGGARGGAGFRADLARPAAGAVLIVPGLCPVRPVVRQLPPVPAARPRRPPHIGAPALKSRRCWFIVKTMFKPLCCSCHPPRYRLTDSPRAPPSSPAAAAREAHNRKCFLARNRIIRPSPTPNSRMTSRKVRQQESAEMT